GLGAHLIALRRTEIGSFRVEDSVTLPDLEARPAERRVAPPSWIALGDIPLPFPAIPLIPPQAAKARRGHAAAARPPAGAAGAPWIRLMTGGDLLALAHLEPLGR